MGGRRGGGVIARPGFVAAERRGPIMMATEREERVSAGRTSDMTRERNTFNSRDRQDTLKKHVNLKVSAETCDNQGVEKISWQLSSSEQEERSCDASIHISDDVMDTG